MQTNFDITHVARRKADMLLATVAAEHEALSPLVATAGWHPAACALTEAIAQQIIAAHHRAEPTLSYEIARLRDEKAALERRSDRMVIIAMIAAIFAGLGLVREWLR